MKTVLRISMFFALTAAALAGDAGVPWDEIADEPERLVPLLGHDEFEVREKATRLLGELGAPALPLLREALTSADPEVAMRAGALVKRIGAQILRKTFRPVVPAMHPGATVWSTKRVLVRDSAGTVYAAAVLSADRKRLGLWKSADRGATWNALPDTGIVGIDPKGFSLAVDGKDRLHLVYHDQDLTRTICHKEFNGETWLPVERFSSDRYSGGRSPTVAVDGEDGLHFLWQDEAGDAFYRKKTGDTWGKQELVGPLGLQTTLAVDGNNDVHVLGGYGRFGVRYRKRENGAWTAPETLDKAGSARHAALAVDSENRPHAVWTGNGYAQGWRIFYAARGEKGWTKRKSIAEEHEDPADDKYHNPTLAVDAKDAVHVVFDGEGLEGTGPFLFYRRCENGAWSPQKTLTPPEMKARHPQLRWAAWPAKLRVKDANDLDLLAMEMDPPNYPVFYRRGLGKK